jgi:hypothetical protein
MFMDLTILPTQLSDLAAMSTDPQSNDNSPTISAHDTAETLTATAPQDNAHNKTIDPNTVILAQALTDTAISWRIHNCKISKKTVTQELPLPFLYHYDSLDDAVKQSHPLTPVLLAQFNTPMTAAAAAKLIGIADDLLASPWHVKITGSLVVFSEALQLAVRLHWTNTGKSTQQLYTQTAEEAVTAAFKDWQFFGRIDVLYKNTKQTLISIDDDEQLLTLDASPDYQLLPATHALTIIAKLEADKVALPWFETAILERIE